MITEDYVSLGTAALLREKGFYEDTGIDVPTLQMAMKWLREVHHWYIFVIPKWEDVEYMPGKWEETMVGYQYVIINIGEVNRKCKQPVAIALSPESAYEVAIKYCLENLI